VVGLAGLADGDQRVENLLDHLFLADVIETLGNIARQGRFGMIDQGRADTALTRPGSDAGQGCFLILAATGLAGGFSSEVIAFGSGRCRRGSGIQVAASG